MCSGEALCLPCNCIIPHSREVLVAFYATYFSGSRRRSSELEAYAVEHFPEEIEETVCRKPCFAGIFPRLYLEKAS